MRSISKLIREAAKKVFFSGPATSSLVATTFFGFLFLKLQKKVFFLSGQALTPPPLAGPLKKLFFAASLTVQKQIMQLCNTGFQPRTVLIPYCSSAVVTFTLLIVKFDLFSTFYNKDY